MGILRKINFPAYILIIFGSLLMILPFLLMIALAFSPYEKTLVYPPILFPRDTTIANFKEVINSNNFIIYFLNSLLISIVTTVGQIITCSMAAYAFARLEFKYKNFLFLMFLSTMMIPTQVNLVPLFSMMHKFGWINTYYALIIPGLFSAFGIFLMRQYYITLPKEIEESAKIDGCNQWKIFWKIIFPISLPSIATLSIFSFITSWNSFLWPLLVTNSDALKTLPVALASFKSSFREIINWSLIMAGTLISVIPALLIFIFGQKYFISGMIAGSVKD